MSAGIRRNENVAFGKKKTDSFKKTDESEKNRRVFEDMPIPKALATLAVPTIIGQLIVLIYNLADTFFIGQTGNPMMVAGVSLILPIFNISIPLANLAGVGGGSLISRLLGCGDTERARKVSVFSFWLSMAIAVVFAGSVGIFMKPLLYLLGASAKTYQYARQYAFTVIVLGGIPTVLSMTLSNLLRSVGCAKQAGFGVSMGGIMNIAFDPLFMFFILPHGMEIIGVGLATMLSNCISCIYFFVVIFRLRGETALKILPSVGMPAKQELVEVFRIGVPSAVATMLFDVTYIIIDKLMSGYGDIPLAAIGIVLKAERLPLNVGIGLCQGMMPIAAYNFSSGNYKRMRSVVNFSRIVGLLFSVLTVIFYEILAPQILEVFIRDPETVRIGTYFLRVRVLATPFMFLSFHPVNFFQAVGQGGRAFTLAFIRWSIFNISMLFILNAVMGMTGLVWTQMLADILTVVVSVICFNRFEKNVMKPLVARAEGRKS